MAYNESLNKRISSILTVIENVSSKKMFGGVGYLLNGNMVYGVYEDDLILRMSREDADNSLIQKHVKPFDITGCAMKGWIMVEPAGLQSDDSLKDWINISLSFAELLLPK